MNPKKALGSLLRVREIREKQAQAAVAAATRDLALSTSKLDQRTEQLAGARLPEGMSLTSFLAVSTMQRAMASDVVALRGVVDGHRDAREEVLNQWRAAEQQRAAAEKLVEANAEKMAEQRRRSEQRQLDEISSRFGAAPRGAEVAS